GRRGLHEPRLRLGVLEPRAQGLLQHQRHEPVGRRRLARRRYRAPAGARREARAARPLLDAARRSRPRPAGLRRRGALRRHLALLAHALENPPVRATVERSARTDLAGTEWEQERAPRRLGEVEVLAEIA